MNGNESRSSCRCYHGISTFACTSVECSFIHIHIVSLHASSQALSCRITLLHPEITFCSGVDTRRDIRHWMKTRRSGGWSPPGKMGCGGSAPEKLLHFGVSWQVRRINSKFYAVDLQFFSLLLLHFSFEGSFISITIFVCFMRSKLPLSYMLFSLKRWNSHHRLRKFV